jgi:hypothetical protein
VQDALAKWEKLDGILALVSRCSNCMGVIFECLSHGSEIAEIVSKPPINTVMPPWLVRLGEARSTYLPKKGVLSHSGFGFACFLDSLQFGCKVASIAAYASYDNLGAGDFLKLYVGDTDGWIVSQSSLCLSCQILDGG